MWQWITKYVNAYKRPTVILLLRPASLFKIKESVSIVATVDGKVWQSSSQLSLFCFPCNIIWFRNINISCYPAWYHNIFHIFLSLIHDIISWWQYACGKREGLYSVHCAEHQRNASPARIGNLEIFLRHPSDADNARRDASEGGHVARQRSTARRRRGELTAHRREG